MTIISHRKVIKKMNKLINLIKSVIEKRKIYKDFKSNIFGGIEIIIDGENINKIYSMKEYESISRYGPYMFPVRIIKESVYEWCLKAKGIVRIAEEYRTGYNSESFYFSCIKDAIEFKRIFNIT